MPPGGRRVEIPKTIGPFELRRAIGHGTYGHVFEAYDPEREIRAAVKLYGKAPRGEAAFARLRRDAQAAGALGHPNIATVIGVGDHEGAPWVATELVTGVSLSQVMRSRAVWPIERVLDVWRQLCEGLAHAHREGLLHLDLKPTDIRVNADGDVKVVDFGGWHVRTLERRSAPSDESLHYRPPEVVAGKRPDRRADIFAVGAVIYELVTRRKAFPGDGTTEVVRSLTRCEPDLATLPSSAFSPGFERILAASLGRDPDARPASFEDVHADLVQLVRDTAPRLHGPDEAPAYSPPEREGLLEELTRARAEDRLEDAMDVCRQLLALDPDDETARRSLSDVESVLLSREADELVGQALTLAADGEIERATRLAEKVERLAPWSPRYLELQVYLDEESARRAADQLVATAQIHRTEGRDHEARDAAQQALAALPGHAEALRLLERVEPAESPAGPVAPATKPGGESVEAPVSAFPPESGTLTPATALAEATADGPVLPRSPQPEGPPEEADEPSEGSEPPDAEEPPENPPADSRRRAAALTAEALRHFTASDHRRAREAVGQALELDPANPRARDLQRILRVLG